MDEPLRATIVMPTAAQAAEKLADLETCLPYWKANPGLLIVNFAKPARTEVKFRSFS